MTNDGELDKRDVELTERVIEALPDLMGRAAADKPARIDRKSVV